MKLEPYYPSTCVCGRRGRSCLPTILLAAQLAQVILLGVGSPPCALSYTTTHTPSSPVVHFGFAVRGRLVGWIFRLPTIFLAAFCTPTAARSCSVLAPSAAEHCKPLRIVLCCILSLSDDSQNVRQLQEVQEDKCDSEQQEVLVEIVSHTWHGPKSYRRERGTVKRTICLGGSCGR